MSSADQVPPLQSADSLSPGRPVPRPRVLHLEAGDTVDRRNKDSQFQQAHQSYFERFLHLSVPDAISEPIKG